MSSLQDGLKTVHEWEVEVTMPILGIRFEREQATSGAIAERVVRRRVEAQGLLVSRTRSRRAGEPFNERSDPTPRRRRLRTGGARRTRLREMRGGYSPQGSVPANPMPPPKPADVTAERLRGFQAGL